MNNFLTLPKVCSSYRCPISGPSYSYFQPPSVSPFLPSEKITFSSVPLRTFGQNQIEDRPF